MTISPPKGGVRAALAKLAQRRKAATITPTDKRVNAAAKPEKPRIKRNHRPDGKGRDVDTDA